MSTIVKFKKQVMIGLLATMLFGIGVLVQAKGLEIKKTAARLVTVHADGATTTVATNARTVQEALEQINTSVGEIDKTEPAKSASLDNAKDITINVYRAHPITVVDGANRYEVMTAERAPKAIVVDAGLKANPGDQYTFARADDLTEAAPATQLIVKRAKQINLDLYGTPALITTHQLTVSDLLKEKGISLKEKDEISLPLEARLTSGMTISIAKVERTTQEIDEVIKAPVEQEKDANKPTDFKEIKEAGKDGKKKVTYEVVVRNGGAPIKTVVKEAVIEQPVKQVMIVGTKSSTSFSGSFAEALARLRSCEGSYTSNTGNGYYGAYQYDLRTWGNYAGYANASLAPPAVQDEKAWITYQARGWQPWPSCKIKMGLQDIYR